MNTTNQKRELSTPRLLLRRWRDSDLDAFTEMNSDPHVMEHMPYLLNRTESAAAIERIDAHFERHGFGIWAIEVPGVSSFVGYTGLAVPTWEASFTPCVEVGWRLGHAHWGRGYATEAAKAALNFGFVHLGLAEILSFAIPENHRSRAVMERLGMTRDPKDDFEHPKLPEGHRLRRHVLYRLQSKGHL